MTDPSERSAGSAKSELTDVRKRDTARARLLRRRLRRAVVALLMVWLVVVGWMAHDRGVHVWGPGYVGWLLNRPDSRPEPVHVVFFIADHFEPGKHDEVVDEWVRKWVQTAKRHADSTGRPPQYTWFYPAEQYRARQVAQLRTLCDEGLGEVQVHLHHGGDTSESLRRKLRQAKADLLGAAPMAKGSKQQFVFVHGNWSLDNSRPADGKEDCCGVNDELTVLQEEGCVADMTFPTGVPGSAEHDQPDLLRA